MFQSCDLRVSGVPNAIQATQARRTCVDIATRAYIHSVEILHASTHRSVSGAAVSSTNQRRNTLGKGGIMARYGKAAAKSVKSAMDREKRGTLRSGKGGKGGRVTSRKQAIAIGLSEARKKGAKVPKKK